MDTVALATARSRSRSGHGQWHHQVTVRSRSAMVPCAIIDAPQRRFSPTASPSPARPHNRFAYLRTNPAGRACRAAPRQPAPSAIEACWPRPRRVPPGPPPGSTPAARAPAPPPHHPLGPMRRPYARTRCPPPPLITADAAPVEVEHAIGRGGKAQGDARGERAVLGERRPCGGGRAVAVEVVEAVWGGRPGVFHPPIHPHTHPCK
jgi:hypothetical protein